MLAGWLAGCLSCATADTHAAWLGSVNPLTGGQGRAIRDGHHSNQEKNNGPIPTHLAACGAGGTWCGQPVGCVVRAACGGECVATWCGQLPSCGHATASLAPGVWTHFIDNNIIELNTVGMLFGVSGLLFLLVLLIYDYYCYFDSC